MNYQDFRKAAEKQDKRNIFKIENKVPDNIPKKLVAFYQECNPVDVEVLIEEISVRFYPVQALSDLQEEYELPGDRFVIATCNGEPVYLYNDKVYTCYVDSDTIEDELLADSFDLYLQKIVLETTNK